MTRRDAVIIVLLSLLVAAIAQIMYLRQELENETLFSEQLRMSLAFEQRRIPAHCPEDATLIGVGQFEAGQWDAFECYLSVDDFE